MKKKSQRPEGLAVFSFVLEIQQDRPGWRFMLIGGDKAYPYKRSKSGLILGVNRKKKPEVQGWKAEFFGSIDPKSNTGQRHAESGWYASPIDAVIIACARARQAIKNGAPQ